MLCSESNWEHGTVGHGNLIADSELPWDNAEQQNPIFNITKKAAEVKTPITKRPKIPKKVIRKKCTNKKKDGNKHSKFVCKMCGAGFARSVQLGGHTAKFHPGSSKAYIEKKKTREANTYNRECLKMAKKWFTENVGLCPVKHRAQITAIKKSIANKIPIDIDRFKTAYF